MKGRISSSESQQMLLPRESSSSSNEIESVFSQSRSTPTILPSLPSSIEAMTETQSGKSDSNTRHHFVDRLRANSSSAAAQISEPLSQGAPIDVNSPHKVEFRKSKSLARKIKERSGVIEALKLDHPHELDSPGGNHFDRTPVSAMKPLSMSSPFTPIAAASLTSAPPSMRDPNQLPSRSSSVASDQSQSSNTPGQLSAMALPKSANKSHNASHNVPVRNARAVPNLTLDRLASSTATAENTPKESEAMSSSNANNAGTPVFQHFSFPKSLTGVSGGTPSTSSHGKHNLISPIPTEYRSKTKVTSDIQPSFVVVDLREAAPKTEDKASENDRILQQRLQQAKALSRKDDTGGAVMHRFALWGKSAAAAPPSAAIIDNDDDATKGTIDVSTSASQPKSASKLRGPKIVRENKQLGHDDGKVSHDSSPARADILTSVSAAATPIVLKKKGTQSVPSTPLTAPPSAARVPPNTRHTIAVASTTLHTAPTFPAAVAAEEDSYSDEEFEHYDQESTTGGVTKESHPQPKSLALALRNLVVEAKTLGSDLASPPLSDPSQDQSLRKSPLSTTTHSLEIAEEDVENSYSSFVLPKRVSTHANNGGGNNTSSKISRTNVPLIADDDIPAVVDDEDSSNEWEDSGSNDGDGRRAINRSFSADCGGSETPRSIQTIMSKSGPAAFLSTVNSEQNSRTNLLLDEPQPLGRTKRALSCGVEEMRLNGGNTTSGGIAYQPVVLTSLTSRDEKDKKALYVVNPDNVSNSLPSTSSSALKNNNGSNSANTILVESSASKYQHMKHTRALQEAARQLDFDSVATNIDDRQAMEQVGGSRRPSVSKENKINFATKIESSYEESFASPRLTELSDSEGEEVKATIPIETRGVTTFDLINAGAVVVTSLNPTGNPFHRNAQFRTERQPHLIQQPNNNPPLYSQPQAVRPVDISNLQPGSSSKSDQAHHDKHRYQQQRGSMTAAAEKISIDVSTPVKPSAHDIAETNDNVSEEVAGSPLKWIKGDVIGEGTFGKVFKGLNEKTGELLAIKQLYLADGSEDEVEELRREIGVMWELDHEHIVRYLGTTKTERFLYIILEFVTGGSIASMLSQYGAFTESLIRRFSYHILSGVTYLHSRGIIHRDIKGANILVTDAGIAKLADFGCSKRMAGLCTTSLEESMHAMRGSVPWMAPEVIKQAGYGRSSDIWSFGATVIEMATGKPPWSEYSTNLAALFHVATSNEPPVSPPHLTPVCRQFLERCMVIDPEKRSTASNLLTESAFLQEEVEKRAQMQQQQQHSQNHYVGQSSAQVLPQSLYSTPVRSAKEKIQRPAQESVRLGTG